MMLCVYCRRSDQPMVLDPDLAVPVAMCADCWATRVPVPEPSEGETP